MSETINLAEARKNLPRLADSASAGQSYIVSRRGREVAVLIGIEEYTRLKLLEQQQRQQDFDLLLAPPGEEAMSEDESRQMAVQIVREARAKFHRSKTS
jgi:antitoxin Phd